MTDNQSPKSKSYPQILSDFISDVQNEQDTNLSIILLRTLNSLVVNSNETTMQGFLVTLKKNIADLFRDVKAHPSLENRSTLTFKSIADIYLHLITKHIRGLEGMDAVKTAMLKVANKLLENFETAKNRIFTFSQQIIKDGDVG